jgi:hypothetical protein
MAKKLARTVHVRNPDSNRVEVFEAGSTPPSWAAGLIENPQAWGDDVPAEVAEAAESGAPAKSASKADWVAYAVAQGMDEAEADAMTKDDLQAALEG